MSAVCTREEEVLGNRDLLQRVFRLVLGGKGDSSDTVPIHFQHAKDWGYLLLVNHFWKVVGVELATTAQLTVTLRSEKGLAHATSGKFRVKECHVDLENTAKWLGQLRDSQLRTCLRTVTLNDWSVVKEDALLFFEECCNEGAFPELDTMNFRRVIPTQLMLPSQITRVGLEEIRPPYGNLPAGASGQFYVKLKRLEMLDSLEVLYVPISSYSMRLHAVRLTEFLFIPRLRVLRLIVPGLHDETEAASFLGPIFTQQLRKSNLQDIDITLITVEPDGERSEDKQELARLVQEVCKKAGDLFACTYYGPGQGQHSRDPRVVLKRRKIPQEDALQAIIRRAETVGFLDMGTDFTKQVLFNTEIQRAVAATGLPVHLHFGWHMTSEELLCLVQLNLRVGGIHWFQKEARGIKALTSPAWKEPAKSVTALHNLYVRENDKSLPSDYPGLRELGLRGRPRPNMIPSACDNLSLAYQDGRACTQGLEGLQQVKVLRLEHVKVTCLPPNLEELTLFRCRAATPQPAQTKHLHRLTISSCSLQVGSMGSVTGSPVVDLVEWVSKTRPQHLTVTDTVVSMGESWAAFADQLALSKIQSVHFEGCTLVSREEGTVEQPDDFVAHINFLLNDVFSVTVTPPKGPSPYQCSVSRRRSISGTPGELPEGIVNCV
ncbi:g192 [Coccomyxa elongata]